MSIVFALLVTAIGHVVWIESNCPGGDVCAVARGWAPYIAVIVFLIGWAVGFLIELALPDAIRDRVNAFLSPRKK